MDIFDKLPKAPKHDPRNTKANDEKKDSRIPKQDSNTKITRTEYPMISWKNLNDLLQKNAPIVIFEIRPSADYDNFRIFHSNSVNLDSSSFNNSNMISKCLMNVLKTRSDFNCAVVVLSEEPNNQIKFSEHSESEDFKKIIRDLRMSFCTVMVLETSIEKFADAYPLNFLKKNIKSKTPARYSPLSIPTSPEYNEPIAPAFLYNPLNAVNKSPQISKKVNDLKFENNIPVHPTINSSYDSLSGINSKSTIEKNSNEVKFDNNKNLSKFDQLVMSKPKQASTNSLKSLTNHSNHFTKNYDLNTNINPFLEYSLIQKTMPIVNDANPPNPLTIEQSTDCTLGVNGNQIQNTESIFNLNAPLNPICENNTNLSCLDSSKTNEIPKMEAELKVVSSQENNSMDSVKSFESIPSGDKPLKLKSTDTAEPSEVQSETNICGPYVVGLENDTLICYINSVLQSLFSIAPFRSLLTDIYNTYIDPSTHSSIIPVLYEYQCKIILGEEKYLSMKRMKEVIFEQIKFFEDGIQQDAHEFFILFIDCVENEILKIQEKCVKKRPFDSHRSFVDIFNEMFYGNIRYILECGSCQFSSTIKERFNHITVPMVLDNSTDFKDLNSYLEYYFSDKYIKSNYPWKCEKCGNCASKHRLVVENLPSVLIFHLQRNTITGFKIMTRFDFPKNELVFSVPLEKSTNSMTFKLMSVVHHQGLTTTSGHYVASCRRPSKPFSPGSLYWYLFDDYCIYELNYPLESQHISTDYLIFYSNFNRL